MYVYTYTYIYVYIYMYIYLYLYINIQKHVHVFIALVTNTEKYSLDRESTETRKKVSRKFLTQVVILLGGYATIQK